MNLLFENLEKLIDAPNGIEKARELILQLAVQGKLVKQDPNDEPASELLKKIVLAKEHHLISKKMRKDDFDYSAKNKTVPFVLPSKWEWVSFGEIVIIIRGITFPSSAKYKSPIEGLVVCLRTANVQRKVDWNNLIYIPPKFVKNNYQWVEKNDILISMANSLELVGKVSLVENVPTKSTFGGFISVIRPFVIDHIFLWLALSSRFFQESMRETASQTTNIANISLGGIKPLPFPLPPLNEQKRIVEKVNSLISLLDELEEKRERRNQKRIKLNNASLEKLLTSKDNRELKTNWKRIEESFSTLYSVPENVEKLKQAILQLAVQGKLVKQDQNDEPALELLKKIKKEKEKLIGEGKIKKQNELPPIKDEEKPFQLPNGWEWARMVVCGAPENNAIVDGPFGSNLVLADYDPNGEYPVISISNIDEGFDYETLRKINEKKFQELKRSAVKSGDILIAKIGSSYGKVGFYPDNLPVGIIPANLLKITMNPLLDKEYVVLYLRSPFFKELLDKIVKFTAQPAFNMSAFKQLLFIVPPLNEQKRIVKKVNELMSLCNTLEEKLTKKEETAERLVGAVVSAVSNKN